MAQIERQPLPSIPPIGFFQPISVNPEDQMSDVEFLLGVVKKLNEMIVQINKNSEFIDDYNGKIEQIEAEMAELRLEMTSFETQINADINARFVTIKGELQGMIAATLVQAKAYTDTIAEQLRNEIEAISVGDITLYDPSTGLLLPLQTVINNIYGSGRNALTATEYDALDLTATAYDAYDISAYDYDYNGKAIFS